VIRSYEVETGQQLAAAVATPEIRMVVEHARVEHRDHDSGGTAIRVPGADGIDGRNLGVLQVPLVREQHVVGIRRVRVSPLIDGHIFDGGVGAELLQDLRSA